jgi:tyrosyl-tRNA synthetase
VAESTVKQYDQALKEVEKHQNADDPLHPMQIKKELARSIVKEYQGGEASIRAEEYFERVVQRKEIPDEIPLISFKDRAAALLEIVAAGASVSKTEARRLVDQGAVKVDGIRVSDPGQQIPLTSQEKRLQVGKRKFFRVKFEAV